MLALSRPQPRRRRTRWTPGSRRRRGRRRIRRRRPRRRRPPPPVAAPPAAPAALDAAGTATQPTSCCVALRPLARAVSAAGRGATERAVAVALCGMGLPTALAPELGVAAGGEPVEAVLRLARDAGRRPGRRRSWRRRGAAGALFRRATAALPAARARAVGGAGDGAVGRGRADLPPPPEQARRRRRLWRGRRRRSEAEGTAPRRRSDDQGGDTDAAAPSKRRCRCPGAGRARSPGPSTCAAPGRRPWQRKENEHQRDGVKGSRRCAERRTRDRIREVVLRAPPRRRARSSQLAPFAPFFSKSRPSNSPAAALVLDAAARSVATSGRTTTRQQRVVVSSARSAPRRPAGRDASSAFSSPRANRSPRTPARSASPRGRRRRGRGGRRLSRRSAVPRAGCGTARR